MPDGSNHEGYLNEFAPNLSTQREFRNALGQFSTGVCVITTDGPDGPIGMTANSFSAVSLDPPLVLWCLAKSSNRYPVFLNAKRYSIHVLAEQQKQLASSFAKQGDAFNGLKTSTDSHNVPIIHDCLARFDCAAFETHDAGDHAIVVGRVENVSHVSGDGLVFANGKFGTFSNF